MTESGDGARGRDVNALQFAAGLADVALGGVEAMVRRARELTSRSDLEELARDGREEMEARGRLALRRLGPGPEPHFELLARRAAATRPARSDV